MVKLPYYMPFDFNYRMIWYITRCYLHVHISLCESLYYKRLISFNSGGIHRSFDVKLSVEIIMTGNKDERSVIKEIEG